MNSTSWSTGEVILTVAWRLPTPLRPTRRRCPPLLLNTRSTRAICGRSVLVMFDEWGIAVAWCVFKYRSICFQMLLDVFINVSEYALKYLYMCSHMAVYVFVKIVHHALIISLEVLWNIVQFALEHRPMCSRMLLNEVRTVAQFVLECCSVFSKILLSALPNAAQMFSQISPHTFSNV